MRIKPFAALRPASDKAAAVAAVPYDVVNTAEARQLADGNPDSFLHISRPEIDLPDSVDIHDDAVYAQGGVALRDFIARGVLQRECGEALYLYRQIMDGHAQSGLVACCNIDEYADNTIRKHEKTRQDKEDDRTRHCLELNANSGPVFLTYRDKAVIDEMAAEVERGVPLYDFTAPDGVQHTVWRIESGLERWVEAFGDVELAYVADGHHRAAAGYRSGQIRRGRNPAHTGCEEYNWFLTVLFPASQLRILPYNRCVADLNGRRAEEFLAAVGEVLKVEPTDEMEPVAARDVRMYLDGKWYRLSWSEVEGDPASRLDVSVLQDRVLAPLLGIDDPRTNQRVDFIGGIRGTAELIRLVDSGKAAVAFSMYPTTVEQMMDIADADQVMPPKSTWFEPKLRSGLLVHSLD